MRISFPNKEHSDTLVGAGDTLIGAAADNTIVVSHHGVAPHHVRLTLSDRGIVLSVLDGQARTHVNTRPVREKALLRLGDVVSLDALQLVLKPDSDEVIKTDIPPPAAAAPGATAAAPAVIPAGPGRIVPPKVLVRGLSGTRFGKIVPIRGRLAIGSGPQADLTLDEPDIAPLHAAIEIAGDAIVLRDLGSSGGTQVNGVTVRDAILHPGDQIAFERSRFLLEAPGLPARPLVAAKPVGKTPNITQTMQAINVPDAALKGDDSTRDERSNKNDIWWLIAAAALIAAGLMALFLNKF